MFGERWQFNLILKEIEPMTLQAYRPAEMDQLALRVLDISAQLRGFANDMRKNHMSELRINDKKALLWCDQLEDWMQKTRNHLDLTVRKMTNDKNR